MPNLDSGRYFLTCLFPIRNGPLIDVGIDDDLSMPLLPVQMVRHMLSVGATAQQGPATYWEKAEHGGKIRTTKNSHFAENFETHFTRFFVIDNTIYNGRTPSDVVLDTIRGIPVIGRLFGKSINLLDPQAVDQLSHPYLAWISEIDAPRGKEEELDQYLEDLWKQIPKKLSELFVHCHGFDAKSMNAENFKKFVRLGQVETVMPFNDYWKTTPKLDGFFDTPQKWPTLIAGGAGLVTTMVAFFGLLYHLLKWQDGMGWWLGFFAISLILTAIITALLAYFGIMKHGAKPFPKAPGSDLRAVLKSLYLQQEFTDFTIANQGCDADRLHREFGEFIARTNPNSVKDPTQKPGTIRAEAIL